MDELFRNRFPFGSLVLRFSEILEVCKSCMYSTSSTAYYTCRNLETVFFFLSFEKSHLNCNLSVGCHDTSLVVTRGSLACNRAYTNQHRHATLIEAFTPELRNCRVEYLGLFQRIVVSVQRFDLGQTAKSACNKATTGTKCFADSVPSLSSLGLMVYFKPTCSATRAVHLMYPFLGNLAL